MPHSACPPLLAQTAMPGMLMSVGVLLAALTVWYSLRKRIIANGVRGRETAAEKIQRVRQGHEAAVKDRQRIETLMTDAEELTRRLAATLDNKAERVERLLDRVEARLAELESHGEVTTRRVEAPVPAEPARAHAPEAFEPADPVATEVYRLADAGRTPLEIAKELGEHTGKVELILALRDEPAPAH